MSSRLFATSLVRALILLGVVSTPACEKEEKVEAPPDAAAAKGPALDPNLAKVLPGASAAPGQAPGVAAEGVGPPPTGIFGPNQADREARIGSKPVVKLGSEGSAPRVRIAAVPRAGAKAKGSLRLALRTGPRTALPTIDFALAFEAKGPKAPAAGEPAPAEDVQVVAKIVQASLAPTQPGAIPDQLKAQIAKMKGSTVSYRVAANGGGYGFAQVLSKTADPGLDQAMRSVVEAIQTFTVPVPDKPVGKDGFWMATSRESHSGADVVAYRLCKVVEALPTGVKLQVSTKRYAASAEIDLSGVAPGQALEVVEFRLESEGTVEVADGSGFPVQSEINDQIAIGMKPAGQPDGPQAQRMGLTAEARTLFTLVRSAQ